MFLRQPLPKSQESIHKDPQKDENFTKTSVSDNEATAKNWEKSHDLQNLCNRIKWHNEWLCICC